MRIIRTKAAVAIFAGLALTLAGCGEAGTDGEGRDVAAEEGCEGKFDDGTRMKELADQGTIKVGVRYDQPGLGFKDAASDVPVGFDVEIAKLLIADLCIDPSDVGKVTYTETISDNREPFLEGGKVDLVLASYSITDDRRKVVGQAGPYMVTGQQILVKSDSDVTGVADLKGEEVCSVTGSTSIKNVEKEGMKPVGFDAYSECAEKVLDGSVEAMSTDGSILMGLAAQNEGELKVVGDEFSEERIGVGYPKDKTEMCEWINGVIKESYENGSWKEAFETTLGKSGVETPEQPEPDAGCKAAA